MICKIFSYQAPKSNMHQANQCLPQSATHTTGPILVFVLSIAYSHTQACIYFRIYTTLTPSFHDIRIYTYTCSYIYIYSNTFLPFLRHTHTQLRTHTHLYTHLHTHTHTYTHTRTPTHTHTRIHSEPRTICLAPAASSQCLTERRTSIALLSSQDFQFALILIILSVCHHK